MADFNPNIDKITERELVPDIYERINSGKDLKHPDDNNVTFFKTPARISDIDAKTIALLPTSIANNIEKIHTASININTIDTVYTIKASAPVSDNDNGTSIVLLRAYLERALVDISSLLTVAETNDRSVTYQLKFNTAFTNTDVLKIYYYFE